MVTWYAPYNIRLGPDWSQKTLFSLFRKYKILNNLDNLDNLYNLARKETGYINGAYLRSCN